MFAFAIWDDRKKELFLVRDRLGKKPLYYYSRDGVFLFASEVRALLASGCPDRTLDSDGLRVYLHNGFLVDPLTLVRGIRSVLPGHWLRVGPHGDVVEVKRYWSLPQNTHNVYKVVNKSDSTALRDAVAMRLVSDVPIGAFLSGGLDSSALVALMAKDSGAVRSFTVGFEESRYDERHFAEWVSKRFATDHTAIVLDSREFLN